MTGTIDTPTVRADGVTPFIGRRTSLSALVDVVAAPPAVAVVGGEPGVGKSRLVAQLRSHLRLAGRTFLTGRCVAGSRRYAYAPVLRALGRLDRLPDSVPKIAGALRPLLPELADQLPYEPAVPTVPTFGGQRLFRAVHALLGALGPTVMIVEDLHHSDRDTRDLVSFLVHDIPPELSLVLTHRDHGGSAFPWPRLLRADVADGTRFRAVDLEPLAPAEISGLAAAVMGVERVSQEFAAGVHEHTAGLPLAAIAALASLRDRPDLAGADRRGANRALAGLAVPDRIRDPVVARVQRLGKAAREAVSAAAVLMEPSTPEVIAAVAGLSIETAAKSIGQALRHGLLVPCGNDRYAPRHTLAGRSVYDWLSEPERRLFHNRAYRTLSRRQPTPHTSLARHARHCGRTAQSSVHAESAARAAIAAGQLAEANDLLRQAFTTAATGARERRVALARELARTGRLGLRHDDVIQLLRDIVAESDLPEDTRGELRLDLGLLLVNQADSKFAGAAELSRAAVELHERPDLAAYALSALALPDLIPGTIDEHRRHLAQAMALLPRHPDHRHLKTLVNRASALLCVGDLDGWRAVETLPAPEDSDEDRACRARLSYNIAADRLYLGDYARARHFLDVARGHASRSGLEYIFATSDLVTAQLAWDTGDWSTLDPWLRGWNPDVEAPPRTADHVRLLRGLRHSSQGDFVAAERDLTACSWYKTEPGVWSPEASVHAGSMVRVLLRRGHNTRALAMANRAVQALRAKGVWAWGANLLPQAIDALVTDDPVLVKSMVAEFTDGIAGLDAPLAHATVPALAGRIAAAEHRLRDAAEHFTRAAHAFRALPRPYDAAQALEAAGDCLLAADGRGVTLLREALSGYEALSASHDAARCRRRLREHGVRVTHRRGRRGYGSELSPREREVAKLAAVGRRNREIAAALCLSERTVEGHMANVLRKLRLRSRVALTTWAATHDP